MRSSKILAVSFALVVCAAVSAGAATITYGPVSHGPALTNWSTSLSLPQWDPALFPGQVLVGIDFDLYGEVSGDAKFESLDGAPATVDMNLQATITLYDPNNNPLAVVLPVASTSDNVTAFDGSIDFGGTSGVSYLGLSDFDTTSGSSLDFPTFTGAGSVLLPINAVGTSNGSGAGNLILQFSTAAYAEASVTYTYVPIPEPGTVVLAGIGLAGLFVCRFRRSRGA